VTDDGFSQPIRGDQFTAADHINELLLIYPTEYMASIPTSNGDAPVVIGHVVVLDGPNAGTVLRDAFLFGKVLTGQLKGGVGGKPVLGRFGQGVNTKGNPPWILLDFTPEDANLARQWTAANPDPRTVEVAQPATASPPPTTPASGSSATGGWGNLPQQNAAPPSSPPAQAAPSAAPASNGAAADPQAVAKLVTAGVDISGKTPEQIALIAAALG
jgi:hypothetical protein